MCLSLSPRRTMRATVKNCTLGVVGVSCLHRDRQAACGCRRAGGSSNEKRNVVLHLKYATRNAQRSGDGQQLYERTSGRWLAVPCHNLPQLPAAERLQHVFVATGLLARRRQDTPIDSSDRGIHDVTFRSIFFQFCGFSFVAWPRNTQIPPVPLQPFGMFYFNIFWCVVTITPRPVDYHVVFAGSPCVTAARGSFFLFPTTVFHSRLS